MPEHRLQKCRALYRELNRELPPVSEGELMPPIAAAIGERVSPLAEALALLEFPELLEPDDDHLWGV